MTRTEAKVSVIAKHSTKGAYDFARDTKIVRRGDEVFLVADEWCGDNLGGALPHNSSSRAFCPTIRRAAPELACHTGQCDFGPSDEKFPRLPIYPILARTRA